jgi:acetyl-CoA acetyltransferase
MAWILGVGHSRFGQRLDTDFATLAREAVEAALDDAGLRPELGLIAFGSCSMATWGQANLRGQVALEPLLREGLLPEGTPIVNVEGACATGSLALHAAVQAVEAGAAYALAVGVEKVWQADPAAMLALYATGADQLDPDRARRHVAAECARTGLELRPDPRRVLFVDLHALQARRHAALRGTPVEALAAIAAKNHAQGRLNPNAAAARDLTLAAALADKPIVAPLTRAMCSGPADGAAAVLVGRAPQPRAARVRAIGLATGRWRTLDEEDAGAVAGRRAFQAAGMVPADVDVAELHDATSACELQASEQLGLCEDGARMALDGATARDGERPLNPSGGLVSRGHPLAATGLAMIHELVAQLRGEAGPRQVRRPASVALAHNVGGMVGVDHAVGVVTLLTSD